MTPDKREDTMADQTEQEQIDPIARCIQWLSFMVTNAEDRRIVQAELESIRSAHQQETSRLLAALSTVDSQIHQQAELLAQRWDTVERLTKQHNEWKAQAEQHAAHLRERDAQIARLSTQVEDAEQWYRVTYTSLCDQAAQAVTLRAERDAAQQTLERCREVQQTTAEAWRIEHEEMTQQIATLTPYKAAFDELYATVQGECPSLLDPCRGGSDVLWNLCAAALASTRPGARGMSACRVCGVTIEDAVGKYGCPNCLGEQPAKNPAAVSLGRLGGRVKSDAKTKAARENAKKGGWPKGKPRKPR